MLQILLPRLQGVANSTASRCVLAGSHLLVTNITLNLWSAVPLCLINISNICTAGAPLSLLYTAHLTLAAPLAITSVRQRNEAPQIQNESLQIKTVTNYHQNMLHLCMTISIMAAVL